MGEKLLFIYYQNIKAGGVAKVLANLANELVNKGHQVDILFLMREHEDFYPIDSKIKKHYIDSFSFWTWSLTVFNRKRLRFVPKIENINTHIYQLGVTILMNRWLKVNHKKYDTIISCWYKLSGTLALNREVNHKTIAWEHISYKTGGIFWNKLLRRYYKNLKSVVSTNIPGEKYYLGINKKAVTIYNPMDNELEEQKYISAENKRNIISVVARLDPEKNLDELIDIITIANIPKDWKVIIIGSGSEDDQLREKVTNRKLSSKIEFWGSRNMDEVYSLLRLSKINCLTSKVEALPTILIQSMFFSNVLVAYDCNYGPSDIINQNNGFLIGMGDKENFIRKIELLTNDDNLLNDLMKSSYSESENWKKKSIIENWEKIL